MDERRQAIDFALDLLPYQRAALDCPARFTWNCWARQTGKSFTFSLRRLLRALNRRRNQIILSAGERQSREVVDKIRSHCTTLKIWHEFHERPFHANASFRELEVRLPGGARIIVLAANPLTARSHSGDVFLDEFAMHRDDAAIWASLFPTLLRGDGELDIASTPRGRRLRRGDSSSPGSRGLGHPVHHHSHQPSSFPGPTRTSHGSLQTMDARPIP
jgi:phage FluMu gp28-like protein